VLRRATNRLPNAALAAEGFIAMRGISSCDIRRAAGRPEYIVRQSFLTSSIVRAAAQCRRPLVVVDVVAACLSSTSRYLGL